MQAVMKKVLASALALTLLLSNNNFKFVNTYAEEVGTDSTTEPAPSAEPVQEAVTEQDEENPSTIVEESKEDPADGTAITEATDAEEGEQEQADPDKQEEETAETENPEAQGKETPDEEEEEEEEKPTGVLLYCNSVAEYTAALSEMGDDPDRRLIVTTGRRMDHLLTTGKAVYYAGTYVIEYESVEERDHFCHVLSLIVGGEGTVVKDAEMGLCESDNVTEEPEGETPDGTVPEETEPQEEVKEPETDPAQNTEVNPEEPHDDAKSDGEESNEENKESEEDDEEDDSDDGLEYKFDLDPEAISVAEEGLVVAEHSGNDVKVIALIDTGVNDGLADVTVNLTEDQDYDANGHGTAMAHIIKERGLDQASIISIKAFNDDGTGSLANVIAAFRYAIEANVDIINISASIKDSERTAVFKEIVNLAISNGIIVVAAAGNYGRPASEYVPGNIEGVDTIGACFPADFNSAFAATPFSNYGDVVDYWYVASSTSVAAAQETGVLAAGWENDGYEVTNKWFRIPTVMYAEGGAAEVQDAYDFAYEHDFVLTDSEYELYLQYTNNPPGGGNMGGDRSHAVWNPEKQAYEGTRIYYKPTGEQVYCMDPTTYIDYDAWYSPAGSSTPFYDRTTYSYPDAKYQEWAGSTHIHHFDIDLSGPLPDLTNGKYLPGVEYIYTNTASNSDFHGGMTMQEAGYYIKSVSSSNGNPSAVRAWISGNTIHIYVDPSCQNMPDNFVVHIDSDKQENGSVVYFVSGTETNYTHMSASNSQQLTLPGSLAGLNGRHVESSGFEAGGTDTYIYDSDDTPTDPVIRGGIAFDKDDFDRILSSETGNAQGDATLAGTEYTITNTRNNQVVAKVETGVDGKPATVTYRADGAGVGNLDNQFLKWGDYLITETKAPVGYHLNPDWSFYFEIRNPDGQIYNAEPAVGTNGGRIDQTVIRGGIKVTKYDTERYAASPDSGENKNTPQGGASLKGAEYTITNKSAAEVYVNGVWYAPGEVVYTLVTNEDGFATTTSRLLPYGTYEVKETKAPEGYMLNSSWSVTIQVRSEGVIYDASDIESAAYVTNKTDGGHDYVWDHPENGVITPNFMLDDVIRAGIKFQKTDRERVYMHQAVDITKTPQGDGTLEGTKIAIISNNANSVYVQGKWYRKGETVAELMTNAVGYVETAKDLLPYGSYTAIETQAPVGYLINTNWKFNFDVTEDGVIIDGTNESANDLQEQVIRGDVRVYKYDLELDSSEAMDGNLHKSSLSYLKLVAFDIYNESLTSIFYLENDTLTEVQPHEKVTTIKTAWNPEVGAYVAQTMNKALPYGTYSIVELACKDSDTNTFNMEDAELADSSNDGYRFTDREKRYFQIGEHSYGPVTLDTNVEEVDGLVVDYGSTGDLNFKTTFSTPVQNRLTWTTYDTNGQAVTNHTAFWSYNGDSTTTVSNPMSDLQEANGTVLKKTGNAEADKTMIFKNQVKRNDFRFIKKLGTGDQRGIQTMWVLKNATSGERHVLITNSNGEFNSTSKQHSKDTNYNDAFLPMIDKGQPVTIAKGDPETNNFGIGNVSVDYGIWFGIGEDGTQSSVDNNLGALPYGDYVLDEVRTDTNEGLELVHKTFKITQDKTIYAAGYDLGSIFDYGITMESELLIEGTNSHIGKADSGVVTLKDTVTYDGVRDTGKEYVLEGKLIDKDTMQVLTDDDGNEITSITRLTINANQGTITGQTFTVDTAKLGGKRIVAYEYLWPADKWDEQHS